MMGKPRVGRKGSKRVQPLETRLRAVLKAAEHPELFFPDREASADMIEGAAVVCEFVKGMIGRADVDVRRMRKASVNGGRNDSQV